MKNRIVRHGARSGAPSSVPQTTTASAPLKKVEIPAIPARVPYLQSPPIRTHEATRPVSTIKPPAMGTMAAMLLNTMSPAALRGMLPALETKAREALEKLKAPKYVKEAAENLGSALRRWNAEFDKESTKTLDTLVDQEKKEQKENSEAQTDAGKS
jgi:hypothetical protein